MPVIAWAVSRSLCCLMPGTPKKLLKRIGDYGWYFVCQLKKNRRFEGHVLKVYPVATIPGMRLGTMAGGLRYWW